MSLELIADRTAGIAGDAILLVSCVRDESLRLPYFFEYHRSLGVDHFLIVDNGSTDGSREWLLAQPDASVYLTRGSYADSRCGVDWLNEALRRHGVGRWTLTVDADELLAYPDCERIGLKAFCRRLDAADADALACFMLDMYSSRAIRDTHYPRGATFLAACPFFDATGYDLEPSGPYAGLPGRGGMRRRLFWEGRRPRGNPPFLGKTPLVKWRADLAYAASTHLIDGVRRAWQTGVLLHFKFFSDFIARAEAEVARGEHWDNAAQYDAYARVVGEIPQLTAYHDEAIRYRGSRQLCELGLMRGTDAKQHG